MSLAVSLPWGFLVYCKGTPLWVIVGRVVITGISFTASSNSMMSLPEWAPPGSLPGDAAPGIYGPFQSGSGHRI